MSPELVVTPPEPAFEPRLAPPPQTVAQLLLRYLELEGVRHVFGIPGGALKHMLTALKDERERFSYVICRHETGAAYIADGYARVSGKPGVVVVTSGPGALNALTGSMNASASGTPLLTLTGEVPEQYFGLLYLQEGVDAGVDVNEVYNAAVGYSAVITSPTNAQTLIATALRRALSVPGRAAHLSLPDDVSAGTLPTPVVLPTSPSEYRAVPRGTNREQVARAFRMLLSARRPLILLGNGSRRALREGGLALLSGVVEKFAIPVITTPDAKAVFPESHPLSLRNFGLAYCEWPPYYLGPDGDRFDALLVLGSALGELATGVYSPMLRPDGPIIQVDLDQAAIGRTYPVELGIVADVGQVLVDLSEIAANEPPNERIEPRRQLVARIKQQHSPFLEPHKRDSNAVPILPQALMKCIEDRLPRGAQVFIDAGNCVGWSVHYLTLDPPSAIHPALDMGPMGFGVGSVIGGKVAAPDRTCLAIVGDGAFLMHGSEVNTAARYGIGAVFVVLEDENLMMVAQGQAHFQPDDNDPKIWERLYDLGKTDLVKYAEALGADAYRVESPAEAGAALERAIRRADEVRKPQVVVARINRSEIPPYYQKPPV